MPLSTAIEPGGRFPVGATADREGVNFSVYSRQATAVKLLLFEAPESTEPAEIVELDPRLHLDHFHWHVYVRGARPGIYYSWRIETPCDELNGSLHNPDCELLDPWAREVSDVLWNRAARAAGSNAPLRARVVDSETYDWEGDEPLARPRCDEIIYELHVRGFTAHSSSRVSAPGTFSGIVEKIPYLKMLGITAVELLPVMAFDREDVPPGPRDLGLVNYWGYSTYGFFAVHPHFAAAADPRTEFRDMVKALHREGIAVILDVVFNHTAEGGDGGPVIHFKALGHDFFYHLDPKERRHYVDYTGCGNTVNCNHPIVAQFIVECLEYWVREMHVDGFRFDLASVLTRDESGVPDFHARVVWNIEASEILRSRMLIAEPWDAVGLHQVGEFPGTSWSEWNDAYRDTIRGFLRGDGGWIGQVASRISGSSDMYGHGGRGPAATINFVTCHDGFTLADLVSYNHKHNEPNGEENRDGHNHNLSWNSGSEGPAPNVEVIRLRNRRAKNFIAVLLLSQGVPMLTAGDEVMRSQRGNNNAYCQDNDLSWFDWSHVQTHAPMLRFTSEMIALRRRHPSLRRMRFIAHDDRNAGELRWYGHDTDPPDWHDQHARLICFGLAGIEDDEPPLHVMINMSDTAEKLPLPAPAPNSQTGRVARRGSWRRVIDTSLEAPNDIVLPENAQRVRRKEYELSALAVAVFEWR
jgi:isoamylase